MAHISSDYPLVLGLKCRAYSHHSLLHPVVLRWEVVRYRSLSPVYGRWLWIGRWLRVPVRVRDIDLFGSGAVRVVFRAVRMSQLPRGASHD